MKRIITLLSFVFCVSMVMAQPPAFKITADSKACVGCSDPGFAKLKINGTSEIEFGLDAASGNPDFSLQSVGKTKSQIKYQNGLGGLTFHVSSGNNGTQGLGNGLIGMIIKGDASRRVGIGTNSPNNAVQLDVAGAIGYNGSLINTSDSRLKKNIKNFNYGLDEVLKLKPYYYEYTGGANTKAGEQHIGVVAQELQKLAPELVVEFKYTEYAENDDGLLEGENSVRVAKESEYLAVKESAIKYMLIRAIQDQQELIDEKDARIDELEKRFVELERKIDGFVIEEQSIELNSNIEEALLKQNNPNPFNVDTEITYSIPKGSSEAKINLFDINGKMLKTVDINHTGIGVLNLKANKLASGTYSYQLVVDGKLVDSKKMSVLK